jgi:hypothetical protein
MKTARERLNVRAVPLLLRRAVRWNDEQTRPETTSKRAESELDVKFVEEPRWESPLNTMTVPTSLHNNRRVIAISDYTGLATAATEAPESKSVLARKIAWAILRARAVAECLRAV